MRTRKKEQNDGRKKRETKTLSSIYCITYGLVFFVEGIKYMERNICHTKVSTQRNVKTTECCKREREREKRNTERASERERKVDVQ